MQCGLRVILAHAEGQRSQRYGLNPMSIGHFTGHSYFLGCWEERSISRATSGLEVCGGMGTGRTDSETLEPSGGVLMPLSPLDGASAFRQIWLGEGLGCWYWAGGPGRAGPSSPESSLLLVVIGKGLGSRDGCSRPRGLMGNSSGSSGSEHTKSVSPPGSVVCAGLGFWLPK